MDLNNHDIRPECKGEDTKTAIALEVKLNSSAPLFDPGLASIMGLVAENRARAGR